jgi:glutaredoxin
MVDVRKAPKKGIGTCVYCGRTRKLTKDHVFPRAIFIVKDREMVTVPSCYECQRTKEIGDRELEVYVTLDIYGSGHTDAMKHLEKIMNRSESTRRRLNRLVNEAEEISLVTEDGIAAGRALAAAFEMKPIIDVMNMIGRGLYWHLNGEILPKDIATHAQRMPWNVGLELLSRLSGYRQGAPVVKGDLVVWWAELAIEKTSIHDRFWIVCFNDFVVFTLSTGDWAEVMENIAAKLESEAVTNVNSNPLDGKESMLPRDRDGRYMIPEGPRSF